MKSLFSSSPLWPTGGHALVRIMFGLLLVYHGMEIFRPDVMQGYMTWDMFQGRMARLMVYTGKSSEFIAGVFITLGLFTRISSFMVMCTFTYITFFVGNGKFWYEDQHPFMFLLFGALFLFIGPGPWNLDAVVFQKKNSGGH